MRIRRTITLAAAGLFSLALLAALMGNGYSAEPVELENGYTITWWTADGGGGASQGGEYTLRGTIGQPDAGRMEGGEFSLGGGFWPAWLEQLVYFYLPLIHK